MRSISLSNSVVAGAVKSEVQSGRSCAVRRRCRGRRTVLTDVASAAILDPVDRKSRAAFFFPAVMWRVEPDSGVGSQEVTSRQVVASQNVTVQILASAGFCASDAFFQRWR